MGGGGAAEKSETGSSIKPTATASFHFSLKHRRIEFGAGKKSQNDGADTRRET